MASSWRARAAGTVQKLTILAIVGAVAAGGWELFAKEAELSIALRHPNIVQTLDVGAIGGVAYLAMEWVDGRDLGQVLRRCRKQGIAEAVAHRHVLRHTVDSTDRIGPLRRFKRNQPSRSDENTISRPFAVQAKPSSPRLSFVNRRASPPPIGTT